MLKPRGRQAEASHLTGPTSRYPSTGSHPVESEDPKLEGKGRLTGRAHPRPVGFLRVLGAALRGTGLAGRSVDPSSFQPGPYNPHADQGGRRGPSEAGPGASGPGGASPRAVLEGLRGRTH